MGWGHYFAYNGTNRIPGKWCCSYTARLWLAGEAVCIVMYLVTGLTSFVLSLKSRFTHGMPFPCRAHAVPLRVKKVSFPFDLHSAFVSDSHLPCQANVMLRPCRSSQGHSTAQHSTSLDGRAVLWPWEERHEKNGMVGAWHGHGHGMASVNQTRPHCVMGKTHSKPLAARHGRRTAWARHGKSVLCVDRPLVCQSLYNSSK